MTVSSHNVFQRKALAAKVVSAVERHAGPPDENGEQWVPLEVVLHGIDATKGDLKLLAPGSEDFVLKKTRKGYVVALGAEAMIAAAERALCITPCGSVEGTAVYPTTMRVWKATKSAGGLRATPPQKYLYLSPPGVEVEGGAAAQVFISVDIARAAASGIAFFTAQTPSGPMLLTEGRKGVLKAKFFSKVVGRSGESLQK